MDWASQFRAIDFRPEGLRAPPQRSCATGLRVTSPSCVSSPYTCRVQRHCLQVSAHIIQEDEGAGDDGEDVVPLDDDAALVVCGVVTDLDHTKRQCAKEHQSTDIPYLHVGSGPGFGGADPWRNRSPLYALRFSSGNSQ